MKHRTLTLATLLLLASAAFVCPRFVTSNASAKAAPAPQQRRGRARRPAPVATRPAVDYTKFSHRVAQHQQETCDSCHKTPSANWTQARDHEAAFPDITDYPEHASCINCHRQQFFRGARPAICAVCHTVVSPRTGGRFPFENPAGAFSKSEKAKGVQSEFSLNFPHDRHQDVMARFMPSFKAEGIPLVRASFEPQGEKKPVDSCSICHQTYHQQNKPAATPAAGALVLEDGTFKTTPSGHESCFNCHWQDGGEKPLASDCAGCHRLLPQGKTPAPPGKDADAQTAAKAGITDPFIIRKLLRRDSATFSHEEDKHQSRGCTSCHINITAISLLDEKTIKVPVLTCGGSGCHINPRPKKILNEEVGKREADPTFQCTKCHINYGKAQVPKSHLDAVSK
ncbi:MAG: hypothetical protein DMF67_05100 [Acidobacteria bacterium]|nr:MAG: hypothetical protein DMF67_05100 [Acidobacteriota bacterium]